MTNGRPVTAVRSAAFGLSEVRHSPGDLYATHTHHLPYLLLVLRGAFREEVRGATVELTSGGVVVMPAECRHRDSIDAAGLDVLIVTLDAAFARTMPPWRCFNGGPVSRAMVSLYRCFAEGGRWEMLAVEELLSDVTAHAAGGEPMPRPDRRAVRVALDVLHAMSAQPLCFGDVAARANVDAAYLSRAFKRCVGRTMGEYLRHLRARRAAALLASTHEPLAGVAAGTGFADQSHLCRVFRAQYGVTPQRYRLLMQRSISFNTPPEP
jgi:AraC family transcriptional regulator